MGLIPSCLQQDLPEGNDITLTIAIKSKCCNYKKVVINTTTERLSQALELLNQDSPTSKGP